ncbi:hypothetical protein V1519DRAFT_446381 [Lipomyces tetrasporus]
MAPQIALSYRLYFLYLEPLFALHGAYLSMFRPQVFLAMTVPDSLLQSGPDSISREAATGSDVFPFCSFLVQ